MVLRWVYGTVFTTYTSHTFDLHTSTDKYKQPRLCLQGKNKRRRSDRNHHIPANSQMILYNRVGRSLTYQSLVLHFFLLDDVLNKLKLKLSKERELPSLS